MPRLTEEFELAGVIIEEFEVQADRSAAPVPVRVYRPSESGTGRAALLALHGGGFVVGSIASEHAHAVRISKSIDSIVVVVDYRLAPGNAYPAALDDVRAVLDWVVERAPEWGVDRGRLGVMGESTGWRSRRSLGAKGTR